MQRFTTSHSAQMLILMMGGLCISRFGQKKGDADHIRFIWGDPYEYNDGKWSANEQPMRKIAATEMHDYWFAEVVPPFRRLQYAFVVTDDHEDIFFGSSGVCPYNEKNTGNDSLLL